jgi:putative two-component system response regulator
VAVRTQDLRDAVHSLEKTQVELKTAQEETVVRLAKAAEFRDNETAQHIHRMSQYCAIIARKTGLSVEECEFIRLTSSMHDVGKIGTPDQILLKRGKLTNEEFEIMKEHAEIGYRILVGSGSKILDMAASIAWTHHERIDGNGYPNGLMGDEIPIEGRIATIADVFDALTSKRVYKPAFSVEKALEIMIEGLGTQFDKEFFGLFQGAMDEVLEIKERFSDL